MNQSVIDDEHGSLVHVAKRPRQEVAATILLADDDDSLRTRMAQVLSDVGYRVITAEDGLDAVVKFLAYRDSIRFMILDEDMPLRNGKEAFDEISRVCPGVKVLFMSSSTSDNLGDVAREAGPEIIMKPFSLQELKEKTQEMLASA